MIAYGIPADLVDVNLAMSESQAIKCVKRFVVVVVKVIGQEHLRTPNAQDTARLLEINVWFPGMLGLFISCTRGGKTILQHGMDNSWDTRRTPPSFLKSWLITRCEFGMIFLDARFFQ
jgi:hypothetical protein